MDQVTRDYVASTLRMMRKGELGTREEIRLERNRQAPFPPRMILFWRTPKNPCWTKQIHISLN